MMRRTAAAVLVAATLTVAAPAPAGAASKGLYYRQARGCTVHGGGAVLRCGGKGVKPESTTAPPGMSFVIVGGEVRLIATPSRSMWPNLNPLTWF